MNRIVPLLLLFSSSCFAVGLLKQNIMNKKKSIKSASRLHALVTFQDEKGIRAFLGNQKNKKEINMLSLNGDTPLDKALFAKIDESNKADCDRKNRIITLLKEQKAVRGLKYRY